MKLIESYDMKQNTMKCFLLILCLTAFAIVIIPQAKKFKDNNISVAKSQRHILESIDFPYVIFCRRNASRSEIYNPDLPRQLYLNMSSKPLIDLGWVSRYEHDPNPYRPDYEDEWLFTYYFGLCNSFKLKKAFPPGNLLAFQVWEDADHLAYYVKDFYEQLLLSYMVISKAPAMVSFSKSILSTLEIKEFLAISKPNKPCLSGEDSKEPHSACVVRNLEDEFRKRNVTCVSVILKKFLPTYKDKECEGEEDILRVNTLANLLMWNMSRSVCLQPCKDVSFSVKNTDVNFKDHPNLRNPSIFVTALLNGIVHVETEYLVLGPMQFLSSVGGALGMFLGWSMYQNLHLMWQWFRSYMH